MSDAPDPVPAPVPAAMPARMPAEGRHFRPLALGLLVLTAAAGGALFGGLTNAVNGQVSPTYFAEVLRWGALEQDEIPRAAIAQGIFEGVLFGLGLGLFLAVVAAIASRATTTYRRALAYLVAVLIAAALAWILGGLLGMGLAALSPGFYRENFRGAPADPVALRGYAWVGGSILGSIWGGVLAVILAAVTFAVRWRRGVALDDA